jgi:CHAT domain-containing protein/Flp pilus assembly protein TadD
MHRSALPLITLYTWLIAGTGFALAQELPPYRRVLMGDAAATAAEFERQLAGQIGMGQIKEAQQTAEKLLKLRTQAQGADHWQVVDARWQVKRLARLEAGGAQQLSQDRELQRLDREAKQAMQTGNLGQAEKLLNEALDLQIKLHGADDPGAGSLYISLATCNRQMGRLGPAQAHALKAVETNRKLLGEEHPHTASAYLGLGVVYYGQGKLAQAEPLFRQALAIYLAALGEKNLNTATAYNTLGAVYLQRDRAAEAEPLLQKALAIRRELAGPDHPVTINSLNNLGVCYLHLKRYREAEAILVQALDQRKAVLGEDHPQLFQLYGNLGSLYRLEGKSPEAVRMLTRARDLAIKAHGDEHPEAAIAHGNLATALYYEGRLADAEPEAIRQLELVEKLYGKLHRQYMLAQGLVAQIRLARGEVAQAERGFQQAAQAFDAVRLRQDAGGVERAEAAAGWEMPYISLAVCQARQGKALEAWTNLEHGLGRGLLDDLSARSLRKLDPQDQHRETALVGQLQQFDRQLSGVLASPMTPEARRATVERISKQRADVEKQLAEHAADLARREVYPLDRIQAALAPDSALIAWIDSMPTPGAADLRGDHWACVVRHKGPPTWIRLKGTGPNGAWTAEDQELIAGTWTELRRPTTLAAWQVLAKGFYRQRIEPLKPTLAAHDGLPAVKHLIVLPSAAVQPIPVESILEAAESRRLSLTVSHAPSATIFARLQEQEKPERGFVPQRLLALGDPTFTGSPAAERAGAAAQFAPLPGTRMEVEAIATQFPESTKLLGSEASKEHLEQLKDQLKAFDVLHLATHGLADQNSAMRSALILAQDHLPDPVATALAGKEPDDGKLTALTISREWRLNAQLVTLSACQTGVGKLSLGEGYLGFTHALIGSGAKSLLVSNWQVSDAATTLLMMRFYENWLGRRPGVSPMTKAEALLEAKHWLASLSRTEAEARLGQLPENARGLKLEPSPNPGPVKMDDRPFAHPYYWSSFVLVGDPR